MSVDIAQACREIADRAKNNTSVLRDMTNTVRTKAASLWSWTTRY